MVSKEVVKFIEKKNVEKCGPLYLDWKVYLPAALANACKISITVTFQNTLKQEKSGIGSEFR